MTANKILVPQPLALVIGATGGLGYEVAQTLQTHGWRVRALHRDSVQARRKSNLPATIEWMAGDAMNPADVVAAAKDVCLIVHAANPPAYRNWRGLAIPMLANTIAAARTNDARIVIPGNVYNFGPDAWPLVKESSPQHPLTRKGQVRVEMEAMLEREARTGVRSLIVRAGDFFGPSQPASWFKDVMVKPGKELRSVTYPGVRDVGHAWAYLPDLAEAIVRLVEKEAMLDAFETVNFGGYWLARGDEIAKSIGRVIGRPDIPIKSLPWILFSFAWPFWGFARELLEMRYLWQVPLRLDNAKLVALLGEEPHRPLDAAIGETLAALGCLSKGRRPGEYAALAA
jgi:nucleoside-diphosphate-sugar epimerase